MTDEQIFDKFMDENESAWKGLVTDAILSNIAVSKASEKKQRQNDKRLRRSMDNLIFLAAKYYMTASAPISEVY
jgi:hypothetical protein